MMLQGHVVNGIVVPDEPGKLPEGAIVQIQVVQPAVNSTTGEIPTLYDRLAAAHRLSRRSAGRRLGESEALPLRPSEEMTPVFADATFYIAALSPRDQRHAQARLVAQSYRDRVVTTEYVLLDVGNFLSRSTARARFVEFVSRLQADANTEIVPSAHSLWTRGLDLYARCADKDWSLTDCISFVVMQEQGLSEALTADHDFEQAGFTILLK